MKPYVPVFLVMLFSNVHAFGENALPKVVETFDALMKEEAWDGKALKKLGSLMAFPVTVDENAYEPGEESCNSRSRITQMKSIKDLEPVLLRLQENWKRLGPVAPFNDETVFGVSEIGDCEHLWSVQLDKSGKKIIRLELDAEDTWWTEDRKDFK